ncbi:MAG TPA: CrcB family protein [Pseudolysinimonas sp.]
MSPRAILAVLAGGLIGTGLRLGGDALLPHSDDGFPLSTLLINVIGSFVLGMLVSRVWPVAPVWLRAGLGAGLLGSFTTFSAVVASTLTLARENQAGLAVLYLVVTLAAGWLAAALGIRLEIRLGGGRPTQIGPEE